MNENDTNIKLEEPVVGYSTNVVRKLQRKTSDLVLKTTNRQVLMNCLSELRAEGMPCIYTDEEYKEEIKLSEQSPNISNDDVTKELQSWGFVI